MIEQITEQTNLKRIIHKLICPKCREEVSQTDMILTTYPPQYSYICNNCKETIITKRIYPYEEIVGDSQCTYQQEVSS